MVLNETWKFFDNRRYLSACKKSAGGVPGACDSLPPAVTSWKTAVRSPSQGAGADGVRRRVPQGSVGMRALSGRLRRLHPSPERPHPWDGTNGSLCLRKKSAFGCSVAAE